MTVLILKIISQGLELFFLIVGNIMKYNAEESARFKERLQTLSDVLKKTVENKEETLNEEAYLSNLEWEKKQRYQLYKTKFLEIVSSGGGLLELSVVAGLAMGAKVAQNKDAVVVILVKDITVEEKSKQFAKLLTESV